MTDSWLVVTPPCIALLCALITKRLHLSLLAGIIAGGIIASYPFIHLSPAIIINRMLIQATDTDNLCMYAFLLFVGIMISLINLSGAANAFASLITRKITSRKSAERASLALSHALFIDDYLSNLTVGNIMRPIADRAQIAKEKLAYLVHSMTGPLVIIMPISSWVAMITGQLLQAGISPDHTTNSKIIADPLLVYLSSIPCILYSWATIATVWFMVHKSISYGPMFKYESAHKSTSAQGYGVTGNQIQFQSGSSPWLLIIPIAILVLTVIIGIPYAGGWSFFGGEHTFIESLLRNEHTFVILMIAGLLSCLATCALTIFYGQFSVDRITQGITEGWQLMHSPIVMLYLASTLGMLMRADLHTGVYLAQLITTAIPLWLIPCIVFILATTIATMTGTSWGTIALLAPIIVPMLTGVYDVATPTMIAAIPLLLPTLGALMSGAVCGDHISPISETTIMAATSTNADPLVHAYTQAWYAVPPIAASIVGFILMGIGIQYSVWGTIFAALIATIIVSLFCTVSINYIYHRVQK